MALQRLLGRAEGDAFSLYDLWCYTLAGYLIGSLKYTSTQPRDEAGRWSAGGGATGAEAPMGIAVALDVASNAGVSPDIVEYGGAGYEFSVGDDHYIAAGQFNPTTGRITLYDGAMRDEATLKSVTAHEAQHVKYHKVKDQVHQEERAAVALQMEHAKAGEGEWNDVMGPSGKLKPAYADQFPIYNRMERYYNRDAVELERKDGITPYSKSYWKAYKDRKVSFDTAVNETLAEVASQKALGINRDIPTIWRQAHKDLNLSYAELK